MTIQCRTYNHAVDNRRVSDFLKQTYAITQNQHNWGIDRWDYWCYFIHSVPSSRVATDWESQVRLWETESGELVGVAHPEDGSDVYLDVHPEYRYLESEMLDWAEDYLALPIKDSQKRRLNLSVYDYDMQRQELLTSRGYRHGELDGYKHRREMTEPIPDAPIYPGYTVRHLNPETDLPSRAAASNNAFNSSSTTPDTYRILQTAPHYDPELDMVAVDPAGIVAAFAIIWWDQQNQVGIFEPVGTHSDHRKRGLAKAVLCEGLRRLKERGVTRAYVGSWTNTSALRLYQSVGFVEFAHEIPWYKEF